MSEGAVMKKQPMISKKSQQSQLGSGKIALAPRNNDENRDVNAGSKPAGVISKPLQKPVVQVQEAEPPLQEVEYVLSKDLKPLEDSENQLKTLASRLGSSDWLTVCDALNQVRQISIFQPELLVPELENVLNLVLKAVKNPRSGLCKTAIMACSDLFQAYQDRLLDMFDSLLLQLLLKASQDKKFVCEEAEKALLGMTTWISPVPLIQKLQPYTTHRNPRVRAKSAMCVSKSVAKLGAEGIKDYGVESLMQIAAAQLIDQLPESREAARKLVGELHAAYLEEPALSRRQSETESSNGEGDEKRSWEEFCSRILTPAVAQSVLRVCCNR